MRALSDRDYLVYLGANTISMVGDGAYFVALGWAASNLGSPLLTSIVMAAGSVPRALLLIPGGAVADRFGPRRIMLGSDLLRAFVMLIGAALVAASSPGAWILIAIALVFGVVDAFYLPAEGAVARFLVSNDELPKAQAINQIVYRVTALVGSPLGGILVATGDFALACLVNGITFAVIFLALLTVRPRYAPPPPEPDSETHLVRDLMDGLRYVRDNPILRTMLVAATVINLAVAPIGSVGLPLRVQAEGWGATGLGLLEGAIGLGGVAGSIAVVLWRQVRRAAFWGLSWILLQAVCAGLLLVSPGLVATAVVCVVIGWTFGVASAMLSGYAFSLVDPAYMGRVGSLGAFSSFGLTPVAYVIFGALAGWLGLGATSIGFAVLELAMAIWALSSREIRDAVTDAPSDAGGPGGSGGPGGPGRSGEPVDAAGGSALS